MNEYLKPIFEIVLPRMQSKNIKYWIYGGIGYASMFSKCYRNNMDVDLFVTENDFNNVEKLLTELCKDNDWRVVKSNLKSGRPKLDLKIKKGQKEVERMSITPVYMKEEYLEIKFTRITLKYPVRDFKQVERLLDGYKFFTPEDSLLRSLFVNYLKSKKEYPDRKKRIEDARHLLTKEDFKKYFPNENYDKNI